MHRRTQCPSVLDAVVGSQNFVSDKQEKRIISTGDVCFFLVFATHILRPTSPVEEPGFLSS